MREIVTCIVMILFLMIEFSVYGIAANKLFKLNGKETEIQMIGFFVYFGLFQIAALPLILLQQPLTMLLWVWIVLAVLVNGYVLLMARKEYKEFILNAGRMLWNMKSILLGLVLLLLAFLCYFYISQRYMGWDTTYYIGTVNTTVYTDTMYVYNGNSGGLEKNLDFRYALSAFYMHSAVLCRLFSASALAVQKYVMGIVCIFMYGKIMFAIGTKLFKGENKWALWMVLAAFILNFGFHTTYTTSDFLLIRAYEAKGFCANVIFPAIFYLLISLSQQREKKEYWYMLFITAFASVPVSMSAILIAPAMIGVWMIAEWLMKREWKIIWRSFWCMVPNGVYLILYFLYTQGIAISIR